MYYPYFYPTSYSITAYTQTVYLLRVLPYITYHYSSIRGVLLD